MRASSVANEIVTQQVEPIEAAPVMGTYSALRLTPGTTHVDRSTHYLTEARSHHRTVLGGAVGRRPAKRRSAVR